MQCTYAYIIFHMNSVNKEWGTIGCQQVKLGIGELITGYGYMQAASGIIVLSMDMW